MMLDQKQAFDEVVTRHAKDPAAVQADPRKPGLRPDLRAHCPVPRTTRRWRSSRTSIARAAADLIVVDTPPTAHTARLPRCAPATQRGDRLAGDRLVPAKLQGEGRLAVVARGRTGAYVLKRLAKFVGSKFIDDLAVFFTEVQRHPRRLPQACRGDDSRCCGSRASGSSLVASPEPMAVREAVGFHARLVRGGHAVHRLRGQQGPDLASRRARP